MHEAIQRRLVRGCHDLSEGGLAVAIAEMAFAGGLGATIDLDAIIPELGEVAAPDRHAGRLIRLFSESNTRFLCEVPVEHRQAFVDCFGDLAVVDCGEVTGLARLCIRDREGVVIDEPVQELQETWRRPFDWK
jgi:phosphoribosylformylglycinamidine synthase